VAQRYEAYYASRDKDLFVISRDGEFDTAVPARIRRLGPWFGASRGDIQALRPHYRALLAEQGFVVVPWTARGFKPEW